MSKLLPNLPIEKLTEENDYIGIIEKGNLLKSFFLNNKHEFSQIKIFAIYGEWGSGKSTLMKYLQKELKGSFNTFFFESWEFESDDNLAQSLLEFLTKGTNSKTDEFIKNGNKLLEGFSKSVTFKTPIANFNISKFQDEIDKLTFLESKDKFKQDFIKWENKITTEDKSPDYNIVFIDDLDRCEPENILNLLSAIKLFFTYGKKTIFLCGIDKKAIREAVKTKYGEIVKANEYLEKIFDISFSMPEKYAISKLVNLYFDKCITLNDKKLGDFITEFLFHLNFRNPRRVKKVLNKYSFIENFRNQDSFQINLPNLLTHNSGNLFETYFTIYLIILNEFKPNIFKELFNLNYKKAIYLEAISKNSIENNSSKISTKSNTLEHLSNYLVINGVRFFQKKYPSRSIKKAFVSIFSPMMVDNIVGDVFSNSLAFTNNFNVKEKTIEYYFTIFVLDNWENLYNDIFDMKYSPAEYKNMISKLL